MYFFMHQKIRVRIKDHKQPWATRWRVLGTARQSPTRLSEQDKRYDPPVDMTGFNLRRGDRLQIEQRKTERRRQKRGLQVHRQQDTKPDRIIAEFNHDGRQHRYMNKGYFYKIQKKTDEKNQGHHDGQNRPVTVCMRQYRPGNS